LFCPYFCILVGALATAGQYAACPHEPDRRMSKRPESPLRSRVPRLIAVLAVSACTGVSGCSSVSHVIADSWPRALGGLPEGVPKRPETPPAYLPVHDMPPARDTTKMTKEERAKFEADIAASRSQTATQAEELKTEAPSRLPPLY